MGLSKSIWAKLALIAIAQASPITQDLGEVDESAQNCGLKAFEPKSWAESGAEKFLGEWLDKNGPDNWLQAISDAEMGPNTIAIDCAHTSSNNCRAPESPANCDKYEYYFIRIMASQINAQFKNLQDNLQVQTIKDALKVDTIIKDFDVLKPPEGQKVGDLLNNIAIGPSILSAIFSFAPGGAVASGIFSLIGAAITATAQNLEEDKPEIPEYNDLASVMNDRLGGFFSDTQSMLEKTLLAIFGDSSMPRDGSTKLVRDMVGRMSGIGVENLTKDAISPIAELLKGGEWLSPVQNGHIDEAMEKAFATTRQGLIGNLLATLQVYVEQEMPAYNEGLVQPCTALGTLMEGNSCHVIKHRPFEGTRERVPLEEKYLKLMGDYGIDLHTLIRNTRDCNNGKADTAQILTDGSYPLCFFGMNFAQRVHEKDWDFQRAVSPFSCLSKYQNQKRVPGWITDDRSHCDNEIPKWKPCKVTFEETAYWTEGGLDRYRMGMVGDNIDIAPICPYAYDNRRCAFASNRQCYFNEELKKWVFDVNFPKGSHGHGQYLECRDSIRTKYAKDNRCQIG
ncbi:hypothetical protein EJ05DRAFT_536215 [Pseudovirgaria hyperparasitica]|uniref:Uncharacterized protein n=1 Tax=Pseudovirgaria hyperparasitica TaxID=470096 RepID=A0A6A6WJE3_9PEZI|nr:uncharacterized protein EJ05DRAFT_536215 [Pseudovirgaria hyperparasitica]KAF2761441.1 hypothetical protein EJ05DRAFT_536215 [Pseudovirgaria hyperparasitica]